VQSKRFQSLRKRQAEESCLLPHLPHMAKFLDVLSVLRLQRTSICFYNGLEIDPAVVRVKQIVMSCRLYPTREIPFLDFEATFNKGLDQFCRPTKVTFLDEEIPMKRLAFGLCTRFQLLETGVQVSTFANVCKLINSLKGNSDTETACSALVEGSYDKLFKLVINEAYGPCGAFPFEEIEDSEGVISYAGPSSYEELLNSTKKYILKKMTFKQMCNFASAMQLFLEVQTKKFNSYPTEDELAKKARSLVVNILTNQL